MSISSTPRLPHSMPTPQQWPGMTTDSTPSVGDSTPSKPSSRRSRGSSGASMDPSEEWDRLFRAAERRKLQNRNAQRKYRLSLKKRLENLESQGAHITSQSASNSSASSASSLSTAARSSPHRATSNSSVTTLGDFETCEADGGLMTSKSLPGQTSIDWLTPDNNRWSLSGLSNSMVLPSIEMDDFMGTCTPQFSPPMMNMPSQSEQMDMVDPSMLNSYFMDPFSQPTLGLAISTEPGELSSTSNSLCQPSDLLQAPMNTSGRTTPCPSRSRTPSGANGLHLAAMNGHDSIIQILLENGANVNEADAAGYTALHHAVEQGNQAAVKILLDHGADFSAKVQ